MKRQNLLSGPRRPEMLGLPVLIPGLLLSIPAAAGTPLVFGVLPGTTTTNGTTITDGASPNSVVVVGGGTEVLSGANTYSGGTTISGNGTTVQVTNATPTNPSSATPTTASSIGTGTLTLEGGTLQGPSGGFGTLGFSNPIQLDSNGGTIDSNGDQLTFTGGISDAAGSQGGTLTLEDSTNTAGLIFLGGSSTYSGTTNIASGTLIAQAANAFSPNSAVQLNSGASLFLGGYDNTIASLADGASGGGTVNNRGGNVATLTIDGASGVTTAFSGVLTELDSNSLALAKTGGSTQILSGANAYYGGTTVLGGTLVAANATALGYGGVTVTPGGTLNIDNVTIGNTLTLSGSGYGGSGASGPGALSGTGTAGVSSTITLAGDTLVGVANVGDTLTLGGVIGDSGGGYALLKDGAGTLTLTAANTYGGATDVAAGTLALSGGSAAIGGTSNVNVASGATFDISQVTTANQPTLPGLTGAGQVDLGARTLTFDGSGSSTFSGVIADGGLGGGSGGSLVIDGSGALTLTGANTYTGGTTITAGTLQLGDGGTSGSVVGNVADNGALIFDRSDTVPFAGAISGSGALLQAGSGTTILTGNSGSFTGISTVVSGTLEVGDASHSGATLGGNAVVKSGGTLMGHGTIGGTVDNFGDVRPGGSIGVLTVAGNYTQASSGTLTIEITPSAALGVGYDHLAVGGSASLAGALSVLDDPGTYVVGTRYTILTAAAGRSGSFASVSYDPLFAAYIDPVVSYDANNVYLTLEATPIGMTGGQYVPDTLTALTSTAQGVGDAVLGDVCGPQARHDVTQGRGCEVHRLPNGYRTELWMRGIGGLGNVTGGGARLSFHDSYAGVLLGGGIGRDGFTVGLGGGYVATTLNLSDGSASSQNAGIGFVYGRYVRGPLWLGAVAAYGGGQVDGTRPLAGTGLTATGNRPGDFTIVQGRAAYDLALGALTVEPRATLAYIHVGQSAFGESGASLLDLNYAGTSADEVDGRLTARAKRSFALGTWGVAPWAEAGVQETFSGLSRSVAATDGTSSAIISGVSPAPTAGVVGVGVDADATDGLDLFVRYQGLFSANQTENAFTGGLQMQF